MKTLRTIAAIVVAFVLVFGPTVAFAATTITATANATSYSGQQNIQISGTVSPAPSSASSAVVVTTKGPAGVVDTGEAAVATGTGTYTYPYVSGGSVGWVSGTYTVNATWGFGGVTASTTTTYTYAASIGNTGNADYQMGVTIDANSPVNQGATVNIQINTRSPSGSNDATVTFAPFHILFPDGTLHNMCTSATGTTPATPAGCIGGGITTIHSGFYQTNLVLNSTALPGEYSLMVGTTDANGVKGVNIGGFSVQSPSTSTSNPDAAALTQIQNSITGVQSSVNALTGSINTINSGMTTLTNDVTGLQTSMTASLNTISSGVSGITNTLSGLSTNLTTVNGIGTQLTNLNNAINNNQTYVLVVAALAAITLVLELAILVRKLS